MKEKIKSYIYIILIAIIVSIPLFSEDYNIFIDDGIQHIARMMGTYQSITEGQTFPVIMSNFCNEFGYSWNLFYSPITAYVPLLFHFITNSFVLDVKIFMLFVTILSGITMYEFVYKVTKNKHIGLLASAIYILAPYRLTDMYIRMALAELTSFIFLPMIFHGLYSIFYEDEEEKNKKSEVTLILGAVGLILTHTVIAMYTAIIALVYVLVNIIKLINRVSREAELEKKKHLRKSLVSKTIKLVVSLIFILTITSFFWAPILEQKVNAEYEVFKEGRMERTEVLVYYKLDLIDLVYTPNGNMTFEIGLFTLIGLVFTPLALKKIDGKYKGIYVFSLVTGIVSIIMTLKVFPFEKLPSILKMLQFSFRMLEFSSFFLNLVAAINYVVIINKFKMKDVLVLTSILVLLTIPLVRLVQYKEIDEGRLWPAVRVTENTGRVHAGCASFEYLPSKAFDNLDYIKIRKNKVYILNGNANIQNEQKSGTNMTFEISNAQVGTVLELPYIYYSGYTVTLESNNTEKELKTYESENGFIEIHLEESIEAGRIRVEYTGTNIMKISMVISILAFTGIVVYYVLNKQKSVES